jgi:hypothetical protein
MNNQLSYPTKHWLTTISVGPLFLSVCDVLFSKQNTMLSYIKFYFMFVFYGFIFSIPVFAIYYFLFKMSLKAKISRLAVKIGMLIVAIIITCFVICLIGSALMLPLMISYLIALALTSTFYKLEDNNTLD